MRVIKAGSKDEDKEHEVSCRWCKAVIGVTKKEMKYITDQRDGNAYVMTCPECSKDTWIDEKVLK